MTRRKQIERRMKHWHYKRRSDIWVPEAPFCFRSPWLSDDPMFNVFNTDAAIRHIVFGDHISAGHCKMRHGFLRKFYSKKNDRTLEMLVDSLTKPWW